MVMKTQAITLFIVLGFDHYVCGQNLDPWMNAMLDAVNAERAKLNISPLCYNEKLIKTAEAHNDDMLENDFFDHTGSDGSSPGLRATAQGYSWNFIGENIAKGQVDVTEVMSDWMNSTGHRDNILFSQYTQFGAAMTESPIHWTQVFATSPTEECISNVPTTPTATPPSPAPPMPTAPTLTAPRPMADEGNLDSVWLQCKRYEEVNGERIYKENCNKIQQLECAQGEKIPVTVEFTKILMCGIPTDTVDGQESFLWLRGSAIKSTNNGEPMRISWDAMNDAPGNCARKTFDVTIDTCMDHFNAQFHGQTIGGQKEVTFDTYMERRCTGLKASVNCKQNGVTCGEIAQCIDEDVWYDYEFCIENTYDNHGMNITKFYNAGENVPDYCDMSGGECKKTIAYIGSFAPEKILNGFPDFQQLTFDNPGRKKCWTKSIKRNTCTNAGSKIPGATIKAFGVVASKRPDVNAAPITEFQECSAVATQSLNDFNFDENPGGGDVGNGGDSSPSGGNASDSNPPSSMPTISKTPSAEDTDTKSPAGKSKAPSSKGKNTKAPTGKGKSKAPSSKGKRHKKL